jgi:hypothetical protein
MTALALIRLDTGLIEMAGRIADLHQNTRIIGNLRAHGTIVIASSRTVDTHRICSPHRYLGILLKVGHATLLPSSPGRSIPRNIHAA